MDPVFYNEQEEGWFFYDETWSEAYGPYATKEDAEKEFSEYVYYLETGKHSI